MVNILLLRDVIGVSARQRLEPHEPQTRALGPATRHGVVNTHAVFGPQTAAFAGKYAKFLLLFSSYFVVLYKSTIDLLVFSKVR